ncbi:thiolase family protein [Aliiroseovarius lamellibrachiae]|uniref:thiolase family protein n=1 Tax=Aliiroseovarius lamellibrachiae TaxID=1924933 RepID=UPI001BE0FD8C|nr:thiolase family protein [Aliiroseovarius lamellibrachiae]MBT2132481.1 thiolase family protein [Aliiroseovarius lamellibrachiae]
MNQTHIIAARRTPVAPRNGALADLSVQDLAAPVIKQVLRDAGLAGDDIGEVIVANSLGLGGNPARIIALASGLPERVAGLSVDRQCVGGLDAILLGHAMIQSGLHDIVIAGGVESYSRRPLRQRTFSDGRPPIAYDQAPFTPWPNRDPDMAQSAADLSRHLELSQADQDNWAINSHCRTLKFAEQTQAELVPLAGLEKDAFTRALTQRHCERAPKLCGTITAANMAVAADGAAFVVLISDKVAQQLGTPSVGILGGATLGAAPEQPGLAPVAAIAHVLGRSGISPEDLTQAEIMEAFAVQAIACQRGANIPAQIVNPQGGALARGHPIGASGAILAVRLFHQLSKAGGTGLAAIAAAGGLGTALLLR